MDKVRIAGEGDVHDDEPREPSVAVPQEVLDAARDELENPADETDEG